MGLEELDKLRRKMGRTAFEAQYQQRPVPEDGIVINAPGCATTRIRAEEFEVKLISWDTASTLSEKCRLVCRDGVGAVGRRDAFASRRARPA